MVATVTVNVVGDPFPLAATVAVDTLQVPPGMAVVQLTLTGALNPPTGVMVTTADAEEPGGSEAMDAGFDCNVKLAGTVLVLVSVKLTDGTAAVAAVTVKVPVTRSATAPVWKAGRVRWWFQ